MLTNAQAALQAAATVYSGGRGHTTPAAVKLLAESFKNWLDWKDREEIPEPEQRDTALDAMVERAEPTAQPELHRDLRDGSLYRIGFRA